MRKKILLMILAIVIMISALSVVSFAQGEPSQQNSGCTITETNRASEATFSTKTASKFLLYHSAKLTDGDYSTGAGSSDMVEKDGVSRLFTFSEPMRISRVVIYCNYVGLSANVSGDTTLSNIRNQDKNFSLICYSGEVLDANKAFTGDFNTKDKTSVEFTADDWDNKLIQSIDIKNATGSDNTYIIYEVEIYVEEGEHVWELENASTPPYCLTDGYGTYACECGATKDDVVPALGHSTGAWFKDAEKGTHFNYCSRCRQNVNEEPHKYDNACDNECNVCANIRVVPDHVYSGDCDVNCNECKAVRATTVQHEFTSDCDRGCNNCEFERAKVADHVFKNACADKCSNCEQTRTPSAHEYTAECDEKCNVCEGVRTDVIPHEYTADCDVECNKCKNTRETTKQHKFSNNCDAECNNCGQIREVGAHTYDNECDNRCNYCSAERTLLQEHYWSNPCDPDCNECGKTRAPSEHVFPKDWTVLIDATADASGYKIKKCTSCNKEIGEDIPALGGASENDTKIIVIVSCSVVIGACTIIALYSLVFKKMITKAKQKKADEAARAQQAQNDDEDDEYDDDDEYEDDEYEDDDDNPTTQR